MKEQKGYKCDFCSKMSISKSGMSRHEAACKYNPENISMCSRCKMLDKFEGYEYVDDYPVNYTEFICKATAEKLYHNKVLRFKNTKAKDDIIGRCDRKMPNINEGCPYFKKMME